MTTFYPEGMEKGIMKLPLGKNFGKLMADVIVAYGRTEVIISPKAENPLMFIDLESARKIYKEMKGVQIHFGFKTSFNVKRKYSPTVEPRVDLYIPISELDELIVILERIRAFIKQKETTR